jgi:hypothetical protein
MNDDGRKFERRSNAIFSDQEVERIKELFDERAEVHAGRAALRVFLWAAGALGAGATAIILAYLGLKKG